MDKNKVLNMTREFAAAIQAKYDCKQVFLFGSYAKGTNQEESDIDVAVILSDFENRFDTRVELMRLSRKIDSRIEPHPFREKDFNMDNPLAYEIIKYGQRIDRVSV